MSVSRWLLGSHPDLQPGLDQAHRSQRYSTYPVHLSKVIVLLSTYVQGKLPTPFFIAYPGANPIKQFFGVKYLRQTLS